MEPHMLTHFVLSRGWSSTVDAWAAVEKARPATTATLAESDFRQPSIVPRESTRRRASKCKSGGEGESSSSLTEPGATGTK